MILRVGSRSEAVKSLQEFLNIPSDGIFGRATESAVKKFQEENGLVVDGVVGPGTWRVMGLATTDSSERFNIGENVFTYQKKYLPKDEYFQGPTKKSWIFLHHTAGWENPFNTIDGWDRDPRGEVSTEWVIGGQNIRDLSDDYDGQIVQAFPTGGWGWHLGTGRNTMHMESVGIEICSFGGLFYEGYYVTDELTKKAVWKQGKAKTYYTYTGVIPNSEQIEFLEKPFRGHIAWHKYSTRQVESTRQLILEISKRDGIDPKRGIVQEIVKRGAFDAFNLMDRELCERTKGMWLHTNVRSDKNDLYPSKEMVEMLLSF
jgi:hypothetical protein